MCMKSLYLEEYSIVKAWKTFERIIELWKTFKSSELLKLEKKGTWKRFRDYATLYFC